MPNLRHTARIEWERIGDRYGMETDISDLIQWERIEYLIWTAARHLPENMVDEATVEVTFQLVSPNPAIDLGGGKLVYERSEDEQDG